MNTVLVTGATGYIGSVLTLKLLEKGYDVVGVDNFHRGVSDSIVQAFDEYDNFTFHKGSITNAPFVDMLYNKYSFDGVFHLAGIVGENQCNADPELSKSVNVFGTDLITSYKNDHTILFYSNTGSVYGSLSSNCNEDVKPNPISHYAKTKLQAEEIVLSYPNTFSYRFSTLFGNSCNPRVNLLLNNMVYDAINHRIINVFQADFKRSFIHLLDAVDSIIYGYENFRNMKYRIYNCGSDQGNMTKREAANLISEITGCAVHYADDGYKDTDQRDYYVDMSRILELGWTPKLSMEQGIRNLIRSSSLIHMRNINV